MHTPPRCAPAWKRQACCGGVGIDERGTLILFAIASVVGGAMGGVGVVRARQREQFLSVQRSTERIIVDEAGWCEWNVREED